MIGWLKALFGGRKRAAPPPAAPEPVPEPETPPEEPEPMPEPTPIPPLLRLVRSKREKAFTEGDLYLRGEWLAYTLEDAVRSGKKVYGETAIPAGTYPVAATYSPKFKKVMTQILNVPGFEGIRIHQGVHPRDSLGCPLIGKRRGGSPGTLTAMKAGVLTDALTKIVQDAEGGEIEIVEV